MEQVQDTQENLYGYNPKVIKPRSARRNMQELMDSGKVTVLEKPDGKMIIFRIKNDENPDKRFAEIISSPHRGLSKKQIEKASEMFHNHPCFTALFDSVPPDEYFLHVMFYGEGFSKEVEYLSTGFVVAFMEVPDTENNTFKVASYDIYENFLSDSGFGLGGSYSGAIPMLYSGRPDPNAITSLKNISKLSKDGEGSGAYIICTPVYSPINGELMIFE